MRKRRSTLDKNMVGLGPGTIARTIGDRRFIPPQCKTSIGGFSVRASAADGSLLVIVAQFGHRQRAVASVDKEGLATHIS